MLIGGRFRRSSISARPFSAKEIEDSVEVFYQTTSGAFAYCRTFCVFTPGDPGRAIAYILPKIPERPHPSSILYLWPKQPPENCRLVSIRRNFEPDDSGPEAA